MPCPIGAKARVICVGNLTAGGSGKTPVAIALAKLLRVRGKNVFFLTRGYGGSEHGPVLIEDTHRAAQVGDEALLLARAASTILARDRAQGAALADRLGADVIVMDDGHQNFSLAKTLSLVVVDGESGFGNGLMIPAGPLREPVAQGLARADAVIVVGQGHPDLQGYAGPVLQARLVPQDDALRGKRLFAFAGIGRPEKFQASLKDAGIDIAGWRSFADHHPYSDAELAALKTHAPLVTTTKDFVRLTPEQRAGIAVLEIEARFADESRPLLDRLVAAV
jgi:tetraacyldisaccharide 4'-kinase